MGHLDPNWLAVEFDSVSAEIESWEDGLKASFESLRDGKSRDRSEIDTGADLAPAGQASIGAKGATTSWAA